ncbi:Arm DNA-binding domain-containing protein [Siphonobacter curvatus]|uniref:Arm DNA-binding domain-containing protein n=1 Tax=Siphonobacter curvatus TaxID=2094562 RepID=A0A2S7INV5_9BACT|nr:hypothetical protein C5O19_07110 [Siphonobacter curvatus]
MKRRRISMMTVSLWRHFSNTSKTKCTIYARIKYQGERAELGSTGIKISTSDWDNESKRVLPSHPQYLSINQDLEELLSRVDIAYQELRKTKRRLRHKQFLKRTEPFLNRR